MPEFIPGENGTARGVGVGVILCRVFADTDVEGVGDPEGVELGVGDSEGDTAGKFKATEKSGETTFSPVMLQV